MGNEKKIFRAFILMMIDIVFVNLAYLASFYIRLGMNIDTIYISAYIKYLPVIIIIYISALWVFKMYRSVWRLAGIDEVIYGVMACGIAGILNALFMEIVAFRVPRMVTLLSCIFITIFVLGIRLSFRVVRRIIIYFDTLSQDPSKKRVLLIGAGECGISMIEESRKNHNIKYKIVGVIDDNPNKRNTYIKGVKILGNRDKIIEICKREKIDMILIAIPSLSAENRNSLIEICKESGKQVKIVPDITEMLDEPISIKAMRDVDLRDLLGRDEVKLNKDGIKEYIQNKVILVTGAGGSIGSELCRQIALFNPKKILILDIYENTAYDLQNELSRKNPNLKKEVIIASVRDKDRLEKIFAEYKPQVVFHAAAHKHVPLMEFNPDEAIKNNVKGTLNVVECADKYKVEKFVLISTDKAVNPTNVMGATKRLCEMIVQAMDKHSDTEFVAVRFGNVLGSNGSVIPLFKKQIAEGGPLTLTHSEITRYFMLIPEAAQLVLQAGDFAHGGEIFVLDMGKPVRIYDLAVNLIKLSGLRPYKDIDIVITGLRPGEKLYEELLMSEEGLTKTKHEKIFIGKLTNVSLTYLKRDIDMLLKLCEGGNKYKIKEKLKEIVPTYTITENEVAVTESRGEED